MAQLSKTNDFGAGITNCLLYSLKVFPTQRFEYNPLKPISPLNKLDEKELESQRKEMPYLTSSLHAFGAPGS